MSEVTFIDDRYYTSSTGLHWPRCTTILEAFPKGQGFYSWLKNNGLGSDEILQTAGEIGTRVHKGTQSYDSDIMLTWASQQWNKDEWALLCKYADYCTFCNPKVLISEFTMVSDLLQFGGTLDRIVEIDGMRILLDIKTSNYIYKQHWCQVAAYRELYTVTDGQVVDACGILHLKAKTRKTAKNPNGWQGKGWTLEIRNDTTEDYEIFQKVYDLWKYDNEDHQPGIKTYPSYLKKSQNGSD